MSSNFINGEIKDMQQARQCESPSIVLHFGIFFIAPDENGNNITSLSSFYDISRTTENERYYAIQVSVNSSNTISDYNAPVLFLNRVIRNSLDNCFGKLKTLLSGYKGIANKITICFDVFSVNGAWISGLLFCNIVEPNTAEGLTPLFHYAIEAINTNNVIRDFKLLGATVVLNSYSFFDTISTDPNYESFLYPTGIKTQPKDNSPSFSKSQPQTLWGFFRTHTYFPLYNLRDKIDKLIIANDTASVALLLVPEFTQLTKVGSASLEVLNVGLNYINFEITSGLSILDPVGEEKYQEEKNEYLKAMIPWGKIVGKCFAKGFKFICKQKKKHLLKRLEDIEEDMHKKNSGNKNVEYGSHERRKARREVNKYNDSKIDKKSEAIEETVQDIYEITNFSVDKFVKTNNPFSGDISKIDIPYELDCKAEIVNFNNVDGENYQAENNPFSEDIITPESVNNTNLPPKPKDYSNDPRTYADIDTHPELGKKLDRKG